MFDQPSYQVGVTPKDTSQKFSGDWKFWKIPPISKKEGDSLSTQRVDKSTQRVDTSTQRVPSQYFTNLFQDIESWFSINYHSAKLIF